jgi:hypothetical protein
MSPTQTKEAPSEPKVYPPGNAMTWATHPWATVAWTAPASARPDRRVRPHLALVGPVPPPRAPRQAHVGGLPRAEGGVERGVARAELAAA